MWANNSHEFHIGAWLAWLAAAMLAALLTRNPFYMALVLVAAGAVYVQLGRVARSKGSGTGPDASWLGGSSRGFATLLKAIAGLVILVALLKGLSIHDGANVLFTLPREWPAIGGPITLEGMVFAALDALSLLVVFAVVGAFTAGADYYGLLRSVPAFMHQVGLVTSIAITFIPQTVTRFVEIREAQALRGHRLRRASDLIPLVIPLLAGGMERSVNLAEAMEARGFSRRSASGRGLPPLAVQLGLAGGLGLILAGGALLVFLAGTPWVGWSCIAGGAGLMALTLWRVGRGVRRTRYRRSKWYERDTVLAVVSLAIVLVLLTYKLLAPGVLIYNPLARLRIYVPSFDPVVAVVLLALAVPVLLIRRPASGIVTVTLTSTAQQG